MLACLIVDDEPLAREVLAGYMEPIPYVNLVGSFSNALDALEYLAAHPVDVLFLDIEMPELTGIDFLGSLAQPPVTVFTTAFRDYAFEGFELGVMDFLLKPISRARFLTSLEKVRDFLSLKDIETHVELDRETPEFIFVKSGVNRIKLFFADVNYIQGLKDYAIIHSSSGKIVTKGSVKSMERLFPPDQFVRVHKSFIVAINKIEHLYKNRIILGEHQVPIGRSYREQLEKVVLRRE